MTTTEVDAVVIGSGHNGLVAAAAMADAGWDVVILEAAELPGGAVRSAELVPGHSQRIERAEQVAGESRNQFGTADGSAG